MTKKKKRLPKWTHFLLRLRTESKIALEKEKQRSAVEASLNSMINEAILDYLEKKKAQRAAAAAEGK